MTRVVFFGTPEEAIPTLRELHERHDVALVVTRPDRPKGRSGTPVPPPVKVWALEHGIEVAQPQGDIGGALTGQYDLGVVVAYGRILKPAVLETPARGVLNVHFSLLPRWRGAAPVSRALMSGDTMTGVTIMRLDEGLDTGPVLTAQAVDVLPDENAGDLTKRLAVIGAALLATVIPSYLSANLLPVPQSEAGVTHASRIGREDRSLDDDQSPGLFLGRVRGLAPTPGATLTLDGVAHKVLAADVAGDTPGHGIWMTRDGWPVVGVGDAGVRLLTLQPPGKRPQAGEEWVRGRHRDRGVVG